MIHEDIERAHTLPASFYRDPSAFERTRERVLARSWQLVNRGDTASAPGAVHPYTFLDGCVDEPLVLTRDGEGTLRAMSNVCTHRGNLLCTEPGTMRALRCRYHGRRFSLDGRFVSMPEFEGVRDFPSDADHLPQVAMGRLGPCVFSAIEPAFSLEDLIAPMRDQIAPFVPLDRLVHDPGGSRSFEVAAHWALYVENYLEGFHVPYVHPGLAKTIEYGTYRSELHGWSNVQIADALQARDAFESSIAGAFYWFLFPNTTFNFYPWGLSINRILPVAIDRTRIVYEQWVLDPSRRTTGAGGALDEVEREDDEIVEQVQRGIRSRLYSRGRYSPKRETGVHHFHRMLARLLEPSAQS